MASTLYIISPRPPASIAHLSRYRENRRRGHTPKHLSTPHPSKHPHNGGNNGIQTANPAEAPQVTFHQYKKHSSCSAGERKSLSKTFCNEWLSVGRAHSGGKKTKQQSQHRIPLRHRRHLLRLFCVRACVRVPVLLDRQNKAAVLC